MTQGYFITGTDTGVGKTWFTLSLMHYLQQQYLHIVGMKPVASGCTWIDGQLKNSDALLIQQHCSLPLAYDLINPYAYEPAISPHIAGQANPAQLSVIQANFEQLSSTADQVVVEGAGGWYSPLAEQLTNADLALALNLPIILVVGMRLGCINQACLSLQAILQAGGQCAGWVAMCIEPDMPALDENIDFLKKTLDTPLLAILPYVELLDVEVFAAMITL